MSYIKNLKWEMVLYAALCILMGVLMFMHPDKILNTICYILAAIVILIGSKFLYDYKTRDLINNFQNYKLVLAIVCFLVAIFIIVKKSFIISIIPFVVGLIIVVSGIMKVENALDMKKMGAHWKPLMVFASINILLGMFVLMNPQNTAEFVVQVTGGILVYSGVVDLITTLTVSGKINRWIKESKIIDVEAVDVDED